MDPHSFFADPAVFLNVDPRGRMNADPDPASQIFLIHKLMQSFFKL